MTTSGQQMIWRESLRKPKKLKKDKEKTCSKLEKHDLRSSILESLASKSSSKNIFRKSFKKETYSKTQNSPASNPQKLENFHKELLKHYKEIIKKQEQDLSKVKFENTLLSKKIEKLKKANQTIESQSSKCAKQADNEEKIVEFYKSSIKAAESLLVSMKNEFSNRMADLVQQKSRLEHSQA